MTPFLEASIAANKEILKIINKEGSNLSYDVSLGYGGDVSIKIDLIAEEIFIKHLKKFGNIYSEECGFIDNGSEFEVIIDPIDGSDNFASNFPYYGSSIALKRDGKVQCAVVVNLANRDLFYKDSTGFYRGELHSLNLKKVEKNLNAKIALFEKAYSSTKMIKTLKEHGVKYRSPGAVALSLAYAHEVVFVLFEAKVREFDVCAGLYMCEELYTLVKNDILLVSKDKETFDKISKFI